MQFLFRNNRNCFINEVFIKFLFFNFAFNSFFQEYKKGESQTNIEIMKEEDFSKILEMEEAYIKKTCDDIIRYAPDLVSFRYLGDLKFFYEDNCFPS